MKKTTIAFVVTVLAVIGISIPQSISSDSWKTGLKTDPHIPARIQVIEEPKDGLVRARIMEIQCLNTYTQALTVEIIGGERFTLDPDPYGRNPVRMRGPVAGGQNGQPGYIRVRYTLRGEETDNPRIDRIYEDGLVAVDQE